MPNRSSNTRKQKKEEDANEAAFRIVREATEEHGGGDEPELDKEPEKRKRNKQKNPAAVALGRLGGKKGGPARAKKLSKKRRSEIARKAARARWNKDRD